MTLALSCPTLHQQRLATPFNAWTRERGFVLIPAPVSCLNLLEGKDDVTVSVFGISPHVQYLSDGTVSGIDVSILKIIAEALGFGVRFKLEVAWGVADENGQWNGILGSVSAFRLLSNQVRMVMENSLRISYIGANP